MSTTIISTELQAIDEALTPRQINGVSLFNQKGDLKSRYLWEEKLQMLGCTEEQLRAFAELLAPRKTHYSIRRANENDMGRWFEGRGELTLDLIAWHLLGARVPQRHPLWIAPRAWDWTRFVAIDVDLRGDDANFQRRCRQVEQACRLLDIPPESWLVVPTPSGGRHYYFFTSQKIRTAEIGPTMAKVGIVAFKSKFEISPSTSNGLRLPFGHIPKRPHLPDEWIRFIESYQSGRLSTVNWEMCKHIAKDRAMDRNKHQALFPPEPTELIPPNRDKHRRERTPLVLRSEHVPAAGLSEADRKRLQRYEKLLSRPVESPADIEELLDLGIRTEGRRHEAIMRLAWNFIFVRGCNEEDAVREITDWAYRTGEGVSKDVQADLDRCGHKVEGDVKDLVRRFVRRRDEQGNGTACLFAEAELNAIQNATEDLEPRLRFSRGRFLTEFLRFAKTNGWPTKDGWECRPAAEGIIRKWHGCSGPRYKPHLDWALQQGILLLTKEKRQTHDGTGCARTYLLRIPMTTRTAWNLTRDDAFARLKQSSPGPLNLPSGAASPCENSNRYHVGFPTKEENNVREAKASDPNAEPVQEETEETVEQTEAISPFGHGPMGLYIDINIRNETHAERSPEPAHAAGNGGPDTPSGAPISGRTGDPRGKHPGRATCHLAAGTPERALVGSRLQGIRHPTAGPIRANSSRRPRYGRREERKHSEQGRFGGGRYEQSRPELTPTQQPAYSPAIDATAVRRSIIEVKQALATVYPDKIATIDNHQCWYLIEAMALDPTYSARQRSVLLANP